MRCNGIYYGVVWTHVRGVVEPDRRRSTSLHAAHCNTKNRVLDSLATHWELCGYKKRTRDSTQDARLLLTLNDIPLATNRSLTHAVGDVTVKQ